MNEGLIPRRYAKALLEFARDKGDEARVYDLMKQLEASFEANPTLQQAISNPFVSAEDKKRLLSTAAGVSPTESDDVISRFLDLLVARDRIAMAREIALAYIDLYRKTNDIYRVEVKSARPLTAEELERLKSLIERHLGPKAKIEFSSSTDPDLIGGFTIMVGNERLDASVAGELKEMRRRFLADA